MCSKTWQIHLLRALSLSETRCMRFANSGEVGGAKRGFGAVSWNLRRPIKIRWKLNISCDLKSANHGGKWSCFFSTMSEVSFKKGASACSWLSKLETVVLKQCWMRFKISSKRVSSSSCPYLWFARKFLSINIIRINTLIVLRFWSTKCITKCQEDGQFFSFWEKLFKPT